ncbi:MAG: hypothetical protein JO297_06395 [Nitrososphaeraceae archaeon]|nr:hypothetical protein [Nitrososphaeraceae archaeon]
MVESLTKSDTLSTNQDDISDALKNENQQDIKFGLSISEGDIDMQLESITKPIELSSTFGKYSSLARLS